MRLVLAMVLAGLVALPVGVSAQAGEDDPLSGEPSPSSEPAPEEPALQLQLDEAGVLVVPSQPRTADGYTLEEMERRVLRAKIGLGVSGGVAVLGVALFLGWAACLNRNPSPPQSFFPPECDPLVVAAVSMTLAAPVGMITSGAMLGVRKRKLRELKEAHYGKPRRVQWDLARSRLVF